MQSPDEAAAHPEPDYFEPDRRERLIPAPLPQAPLDDRQRLACLRLIRSENIGPVTFRELVNHFGGAEAALDALPGLNAKAGRPNARICPRGRAESELEAATRIGAEAIFTIEPGYPPALAAIEPPPPLLYVQGRRDLLCRPMVAIVGSRNGSAAGQKLSEMLAGDLGRAGFVVVSGLARGIDAAAHTAALATGTIAVIAGGIGNVYPPENAALQERIAREGVVVSESPPGFVPRAQDFPRRNRLISGMAFGIVIVEAPVAWGAHELRGFRCSRAPARPPRRRHQRPDQAGRGHGRHGGSRHRGGAHPYAQAAGNRHPGPRRRSRCGAPGPVNAAARRRGPRPRPGRAGACARRRRYACARHGPRHPRAAGGPHRACARGPNRTARPSDGVAGGVTRSAKLKKQRSEGRSLCPVMTG